MRSSYSSRKNQRIGASVTKGKRRSTRRSVRQRQRRQQRRAANEDEYENKNKEKRADKKQQARKDTVRAGEMVVPITPQMIRLAVRNLHSKRVVVSSSLIADHLRQCYPVESNPEALKKELADKLEDAVSVGLVAKCGPDAYCLPTLRHQANTVKTDFTRFWEKYHNRLLPIRSRVNRSNNSKKTLKRVLLRGNTDSTSSDDVQDRNFE